MGSAGWSLVDPVGGVVTVACLPTCRRGWLSGSAWPMVPGAAWQGAPLGFKDPEDGEACLFIGRIVRPGARIPRGSGLMHVGRDERFALMGQGAFHGLQQL